MILLDEPCSALDPISTAKIEGLIDELKEDYAIVIILQEEPDGYRIMNDAVRVWKDPSRSPEQLGWPEIDVHYRPGTRDPLGATVKLKERGGKDLGHGSPSPAQGVGPASA